MAKLFIKIKNKKIKTGIFALVLVVLSSLVFFGGVTSAKSPFGVRNFNGARHIQDEIIVKFKEDIKPFRVIKVPAGKVFDEIKKYSRREDVIYAEPNYIAHTLWAPNDEFYQYQWHLNNSQYGGIKMGAAWDLLGAPGAPGAGVVVAVIDTGIAYENYNAGRGQRYYLAPDLASTCFVSGYDFVNSDNHPNDDNSHGTHVAGTIAQSTNNLIGAAGVAFNACLMPIKVLDKQGYGSYAGIANGIYFAADNGAKVINLSLGGSVADETLKGAIKYAYEKGVTIIAAAGNNGESGGTIDYPAAYDDYVIAVGAVRYDETLAYYSSYGPSLDLAAPGGDTGVDQNGDGYADGVLQNTFNPNTKRTDDFGYWFFQGTSMAAPHVSGVAALLISKGNAITPNEVRAALQGTTEDLGTPGRDDNFGWGLIDVPAALNWQRPSYTAIRITKTIEVLPFPGGAAAGSVQLSYPAQYDQLIPIPTETTDESFADK